MSQGRHTPLTPKRRATFLAAIAVGASAETAARATGVSRWLAYQWRAKDVTFRNEWEAAVETSTDRLEQRLFKMAIDGDVTALIFMLRSRKAATYNPNLLVRQQMLQLALEKAKAEAGTAPLMIEGQATRNGMIINTDFITTMELPWNGRCISPHCPDHEPDMGEDPVIVPVPQDGSGKTMPLPRTMMLDYHAAPYDHLPVSLMADGVLVPPEAATDLLARIRAHNRWLAEAYPTLVFAEPDNLAPPGPMTIEDAAMESDPPDDVDYSGGFGRP